MQLIKPVRTFDMRAEVHALVMGLLDHDLTVSLERAPVNDAGRCAEF